MALSFSMEDNDRCSLQLLAVCATSASSKLGGTSVQAECSGFLRCCRHLSFTHCWYGIFRMGSDFDLQKQAEAAMKEAVNADGFERQRWIRVAQA